MRVFLTGGSGVLGRSLVPLLLHEGHDVFAPGSRELDLFDRLPVSQAVADADAIYHLATRIPPPQRTVEPGAWAENDRLRAELTPLLVDAAIDAGVRTFVLPSVTFMYTGDGLLTEDSPVDPAGRLTSMLAAEAAVARFGSAQRRGVVLRLGLLWGPGTGNDAPVPRYNASLHIEDAARALMLALDVPAGVYNVVQDGGRVSTNRFRSASGWTPHFQGAQT